MSGGGALTLTVRSPGGDGRPSGLSATGQVLTFGAAGPLTSPIQRTAKKRLAVSLDTSKKLGTLNERMISICASKAIYLCSVQQMRVLSELPS
jgi:hypothetical protein